MIKTQDSKPASVLLTFFLFLTPLTFSACASQDETTPESAPDESEAEKNSTEASDAQGGRLEGGSYSQTPEESSSSTSDERNDADKEDAKEGKPTDSVSEASASPEPSSGRPKRPKKENSPRSPSEVFDAFSTSKFENIEHYGHCSVFDGVDLFTDEVTHCLICMHPKDYSNEKTRVSRVSFHFNRNEEIVSFYEGKRYSSGSLNTEADQTDVTELLWSVFADLEAAPSHLEFLNSNRIVTIRVDQGQIREATWKKSTYGLVFTAEKVQILELLDQMAKGKRIVIKVGKHGGSTLPLDGFAAAAADYKARVAQSMKAWAE